MAGSLRSRTDEPAVGVLSLCGPNGGMTMFGTPAFKNAGVPGWMRGKSPTVSVRTVGLVRDEGRCSRVRFDES